MDAETSDFTEVASGCGRGLERVENGSGQGEDREDMCGGRDKIGSDEKETGCMNNVHVH